MKEIIATAVVSFLVGATVAAFLTIGVAVKVSQEQQVTVDHLLEVYQKGSSNALSLSPASWDLEMTCASLWMSKQPTKGEH
jgi:hypothetical protein